MNAVKSLISFDIPSKVISIIFHPLFIPVYGMVIIFSAPTLFGFLPLNVKKLLIMIILINNVMLPFSLLPFFIYRKIISNWTIENRRERHIPLLLVTLFYAVSLFIISRFPIPVFLKSYILTFFFISLTLTVINYWWKISIHSAGAGALTAVVFVLSLKMNVSLMWYLIIVIVISGVLMTSRLKLNLHNPVQVWVGFLTGFLVFNLFMWFF